MVLGKMIVPVFTASLVSSKEPSKNELPNNERAIDNHKTPKKFEICYGKPVIATTRATRQTRPKTHNSRSVSLSFKSSYKRCLRSRSPDTNYPTPRSRSWCCLLDEFSSGSHQTLSLDSAFTYTIVGSKSYFSEVSNSPRSISIKSNDSSFSLSYDSCSTCSKTTRSRSPISFQPTCSRLKNCRSRSPVFNKTRCPPVSPAPVRSCLKSPVIQTQRPKLPPAKSSCTRAAASINAQHSKSAPSSPPCLKKSPSKNLRSRSPVPKKSCLKSPTSTSPDTKSSQRRPPCLKNPSSFSYSNQSSWKPSCLRSKNVIFSKLKPSSSKRPSHRLSRLDTSVAKSKVHNNLNSPNSSSSYSNKTSRRKSPSPKRITFQLECSSKSRPPHSTSPPTKIPASSTTLSYQKDNLGSHKSNSCQRSKSPARFVNSLLPSSIKSSPPKATIPTSDISRYPIPKSIFSRNTRIFDFCRSYSKVETKRPRLTVSKLFVTSRVTQAFRCYDGKQRPQSLLRISDYRRFDKQLKCRLSRHLNKNLNREYLGKLLASNMDVRYMTELKNYLHKIRSSMTCGAPECPALQERFKKHRIDHHGGQGLPNVPEHLDSNPNCPRLNKRLSTHNSMHHPGNVTGEAQTKITLANLGGLTVSLETRPTSTTNHFLEPYEPMAPFQVKPSKDAISQRYKADIDDQIQQWIKKIPTRETTPQEQQQKLALVHNFRNRINGMDLTNFPESENMMKREIDHFLNNVNMWYPGSNADREAFKEGLRENLIEGIARQNETYLDNLRNAEDNIGQNYPYNPLYNHPNVGTQPHGMYGPQSYGSKGTQNYVYNGSQPFGTYGPQNSTIHGVPMNYQPNSMQPDQNMYTGSSTISGSKGQTPQYGFPSHPLMSSTPLNGNMYNGSNTNNNGLQNAAKPSYTDSSTNSGNQGPVSIVFDKDGNLVSYGQLGTPYNKNNLPNSLPNRTQNQSNFSNSTLDPTQNQTLTTNNQDRGINRNDNPSNQGPVSIVFDKDGNLVSYGQLGTPYNKNNLPNSLPNRTQNQSNFSNSTLDPTQNQTLTTNNQDRGINRNDNPSILSTLSRNGSKNQGQAVPKPSIRIVDQPNYENSGHTPDNGGQPRRPSLRSNSNYDNNEIEKESSATRQGNEGSKPRNIVSRNMQSLNYSDFPNSASYTVNKHQQRTENRPLRNTTYDLSYGQLNENENIESAKDFTCKSNSVISIEPNIRHSVKSKEICICPNPLDDIIKKQKAVCGLNRLDLENEITDWLKKFSFLRCDGLVNNYELIRTLIRQITPYLSQPSYSLNKAVLKAKIMNVLRGLDICAKSSCATRNAMLKLSNELANRLVGVASRLECSGASSYKCNIMKRRPFRYVETVHVGPNEVNREDLKHDLLQEFEYCMHGTKLENNRKILEIISELVIDRIELIRRKADETVRMDIQKILENSNALNEEEITNIVNNILKYTREICIMIASTNNRTDTTVTARPCLSILSVYTSEHDVTPDFAAAAGTSTPKRKKDYAKLSPEENTYTDKIASAVREWLKTVPAYFQNLDDNNMKEIMINDLAGTIADHEKLGQLIASPMDRRQFIMYYICQWLLRFEIVNEISEAKPYIKNLATQLQEIEVPNLTRSQHGTRQEMRNIQFRETGDASINEDFAPRAQDILEDEISIWMNEYPSDIYVNKNKSMQNILVHEIAENLQKHEKGDEENISNEIKTWLTKIVKPTDERMIENMSKNLRDRIITLPQDTTIAARIKQRADERMMPNAPPPVEMPPNVTLEDSDKTMKEFIVKYVEHHFDEDDPLAQRAYANLLRYELKRLNPNLLKQVYEGQPLEKFSPQILYTELGYVKDISDWLKTLPMKENFHRIDNSERVDVCLNLAKDVSEVEQERLRRPGLMNYENYIAFIIGEYMKRLPLQLEEGANMSEFILPLCFKIIKRRCDRPPVSPNQKWENIADFLDDYIQLNGQDIANDEVKMEVWARRLLKELKKMIKENPSSLPTADMNDRLATVAKPGDETIMRFNHELDYAKEISDWLKNLSLVGSVNEVIIRDLAEKMTIYENNTDDTQLALYIKDWISQLPLDRKKQIDVPLFIYQLLNRRNKVKKVKDFKQLSLDESVKEKSAGTSLNTISSGAKTECRGCCPVDEPGTVILQVIKQWCDNLPLKGTEESITKFKNEIKNKLYQKIIEINDNPRIAQNDLLYVESLSEKVDDLLANIPNELQLDDGKDKVKTDLLDKMKEARMFYKDVTLGDEYMKDLEEAIETVLPNPMPNAEFNPGFEAYKENLAEMFILENFDHANDADKLKYEQIMKREVQKFSPSAQQRTVIPVEEEKLTNVIKSTLFDINMPDEKAMVDNVEEIKTKCEIQSWFERLPLQPTSGCCNNEAELLERDMKVSLLARKMHILEFDKDSDQKMHDEIKKFLAKAPLLPGKDAKIDEYANDLQEILKNTRNSRKCVKASEIDIGTSGILNGSSDVEKSIWRNPKTELASVDRLQQQPRLKSGDILIDIVETWSNNIPLPPLPSDQLQIITGDLRTRLYKKISELNSTNVFDDFQTYNMLLGEEVARCLAALPQSDALVQAQPALLYQLITAIDSVKPLIREERALHEYKKDLQNTITSIVGHPENPTTEEKLLHSKIQEEILSDYIEYKLNKDDEEGKQFYKNKIVDALTEYNSIGEKEENRNEIVADSLVEANKLISELDKLPPPHESVLEEEVEESRMKREVDAFLNNVAPEDQVPNDIHRESLRNSLAKQLHELEKTGHNEDTDQKMEATVNRTLKKFNAEDKKEEVKPFIDKLKKTEAIRRIAGHGDSPKQNRRVWSLIQEEFPRHDSASLDPQGIQVQVDASVYQPDYLPPNWNQPAPCPSPLNNANPDMLVVLPGQSLPPSPGPIGSGLIPSSMHHTITQPTQTPMLTAGLTQTGSLLPQRMDPRSPGLRPAPRLSPQLDPRLATGPKFPCNTRMGPGQDPRLFPGQNQFDPRIPGQNQFCPRIPGQRRFVSPQGSNARVESEVELTGHECVCDFCKDRYFSCGSCEGLYSMNPMICRRPMMPMPCPSFVPRMPCPPFVPRMACPPYMPRIPCPPMMCPGSGPAYMYC